MIKNNTKVMSGTKNHAPTTNPEIEIYKMLNRKNDLISFENPVRWARYPSMAPWGRPIRHTPIPSTTNIEDSEASENRI
jgi:hypothetical protein